MNIILEELANWFLILEINTHISFQYQIRSNLYSSILFVQHKNYFTLPENNSVKIE